MLVFWWLFVHILRLIDFGSPQPSNYPFSFCLSNSRLPFGQIVICLQALIQSNLSTKTKTKALNLNKNKKQALRQTTLFTHCPFFFFQLAFATSLCLFSFSSTLDFCTTGFLQVDTNTRQLDNAGDIRSTPKWPTRLPLLRLLTFVCSSSPLSQSYKSLDFLFSTSTLLFPLDGRSVFTAQNAIAAPIYFCARERNIYDHQEFYLFAHFPIEAERLEFHF